MLDEIFKTPQFLFLNCRFYFTFNYKKEKKMCAFIRNNIPREFNYLCNTFSRQVFFILPLLLTDVTLKITNELNKIGTRLCRLTSVL
jgi:hypothetical protein